MQLPLYLLELLVPGLYVLLQLFVLGHLLVRHLLSQLQLLGLLQVDNLCLLLTIFIKNMKKKKSCLVLNTL